MDLIQDLRYSLRALRRTPGFTIVAIFTLALGIGANTAIFSIVDSILLEPLRYSNPDRIVTVNTLWKTGRETPRLTGGDLVDIRSQSDVFTAISPYFGGELGVQINGVAEFTGAYFVNPGFFEVLDLSPKVGRLFDQTERHVAVVSTGFARRHFGDERRALRHTLSFEGQTDEIAGVMPPQFAYPLKAEVWLPAPVTPENLNRTAYNYATLARLKPGVSMQSARAQLATIGARVAAVHPDSNKDKSFTVNPLGGQLASPVRGTLLVLMGAVSLVLLIACANVANLLLARAAAWRREFAVRAALGATRVRIVAQLATESLLLACGGGLLGLALAYGGLGLLIRFAPQNIPRLDEVRINLAVLAFTSAVSVAASLVFGLVPAWNSSRVDLNDALKQGASRGMVGGRSNRLRSALVISEISLAFVLAISAGLLFRTFLSLTSVNPGYRAQGILVMDAHQPASDLPEYLRAIRVFDSLTARLAALPGVESAGAAMSLPSGDWGSNGGYIVEGKQSVSNLDSLPQAGFRLNGPLYFATMGIPVLQGRDFSPRDQYDAPFVAIISQSLARQAFSQEDPLGKHIMCGLDSSKWMTIVGVVGDVRQQSPAAEPGPELYMPFEQHPSYANDLQMVVRSSVPPASMIPAVRVEARRANPLMATRFTTMNELVSASIGTPRFRAFLFGIFAALSLLLAIAGVYGVMAYVTAQRTSEMGLRLALGAQSRDIFSLVLRRAVVLALIGVTIGVGASLGAARVIGSMLFGVRPLDMPTYLTVLIAIPLVAILAASIPAWRASRIDPLNALRQE